MRDSRADGDAGRRGNGFLTARMRVSFRSPWTAFAAIVLLSTAIGVLAALGTFHVAPPTDEFDAFVTLPIIDGLPLFPRDQLIEEVNGLGFAAAVAARVSQSPWEVWRAFSVTAEGQTLVVHVSHPDRAAGERLVTAVQQTVLESLTARYEAIVAAHRRYRKALDEQAKAVNPERSRATAITERGEPEFAWMLVQRELRDVAVLEARSEAPRGWGAIQRHVADSRQRRDLFVATGAVAGALVGGLAFVISRRHQALLNLLWPRVPR